VKNRGGGIIGIGVVVGVVKGSSSESKGEIELERRGGREITEQRDEGMAL